MTAESFAGDKVLVLEASYAVASSRQQHDDACRNQAAAGVDDAEDLENAHDSVHGSSHVVGGDLPDDGVKLGRCRTYSEEEGDLDEDENEGAASVESATCFGGNMCRQHSQ